MNRENCTDTVRVNETTDSKHWVSLSSLEDGGTYFLLLGRIDCLDLSLADTDEDYVDITWKITFSGLKPHYTSLWSTFGSASRPDVFKDNQTKYESHEAQDLVELMSASSHYNFFAQFYSNS